MSQTTASDTDGWSPSIEGLIILALLLIIVCAAILARLPMAKTPFLNSDDPYVALHVKSDAVTFVPADTLDLVASGRPRSGILPNGGIYEGIRFETPSGLSALQARLGQRLAPDLTPTGRDPGTLGVSRSMSPDSGSGTIVLKSFVVTPGCEVRMELLPDRRIALRVGVDPFAGSSTVSAVDPNWFTGWARAVTAEADGPSCGLYAEAESIDAGSPPVSVRRTIERGAPTTVGFEFRPADRPLHFRRFGIDGLGFMVKGTGEVQSTILGGTFRLPRHGNLEERLEVGDRLGFGRRVKGEIVELGIGDTLTTIFKGTASEPTIEERDYGVSALRNLYHNEGFRIFVGVLVAALGLLFAWLQIE